MSELKTLKDIEDEFRKEYTDEDSIPSLGDIRDEAIEWVKELQYWLWNPDKWKEQMQKSTISGSYPPREIIGGQTELELRKIDEKYWNERISRMVIDYNAQIEWIMHFFNLTREDLK